MFARQITDDRICCVMFRTAGKRMFCALLMSGSVLLSSLAGSAKADNKSAREQLTEDAMRLLHNNCLSCHNAEKEKGGLQLTSRSALLKGGDSGSVVLPGKPDKSLIVQVLASDADPHMPPKKQLSTNQIQTMRRWVAAGAPWDDTALARAAAPRQVALEKLPDTYQPAF